MTEVGYAVRETSEYIGGWFRPRGILATNVFRKSNI